MEVRVPPTWRVLPFERYSPIDFEKESKRKFRVLRVGGDKYLFEEKKVVKVFWKEQSRTFAFVTFESRHPDWTSKQDTRDLQAQYAR